MLRIVSGGQTGVDRGALDAALKLGVPCGGWCPQGRKAEDGRIPGVYPVRELEGAGYSGRTLRNVIDSDGTVILYFGVLTGGSHLTAASCRRERKPSLLLDATRLSPEVAAAQILDFIAAHGIETLNVAGPRESHAPRAYRFAFETVTRLLMRQVTGDGRQAVGR